MAVEVVVGAIVLAALHVVGSHLRFVTYVPRSSWLSFAGGVSVAYVFVHLLPEMADGARTVSETTAFAEHSVWLAGLAGLVVFYWVENASRRSRGEMRGERPSSARVFWASVASYGVYNAVVGYLLHERNEEGVSALAVFVVAIGVHFLVNDFALSEHHKERYRRVGRWILVVAILAGAGAGAAGEVAEVRLAYVVAFIAGGVVLNVFKEELPSESESRFPAFAGGVVAYAAILLAL
ncbi:MAG TPA: hypothetical protein VEU29_04030 [Actinomycetota bacterium]|nr:hypothetical protein [Actinomycetota bacterium]